MTKKTQQICSFTNIKSFTPIEFTGNPCSWSAQINKNDFEIFHKQNDRGFQWFFKQNVLFLHKKLIKYEKKNNLSARNDSANSFTIYKYTSFNVFYFILLPKRMKSVIYFDVLLCLMCKLLNCTCFSNSIYCDHELTDGSDIISVTGIADVALWHINWTNYVVNQFCEILM